MRMTPELKQHIQYQAKLELARRDFFDYCELMAPDFYKRSRPYLLHLTATLQHFVSQSIKKVLIVSMPPRTGNLEQLLCSRNGISVKIRHKRL